MMQSGLSNRTKPRLGGKDASIVGGTKPEVFRIAYDFFAWGMLCLKAQVLPSWHLSTDDDVRERFAILPKALAQCALW